MDRDAVDEVVALWNKQLPFIRMHFAVKAHSDPLLLTYLSSLGCSFDCASDVEMQLARICGAGAGNVVLSNPAKNYGTIEAITEKPSAIVIDTLDELDRVASIVRGIPDYFPTILVRILIRATNVQDDLSSKYGARASRALDLLRLARNRRFQSLGLAFHVGTQAYLIDGFERAIHKCLKIAEKAKREGLVVSVVDIGGGFCDKRTAIANGVSMDALLSDLSRILAPLSSKFQLIGEPGRLVVADAGVLLVRIIAIDLGGAKKHRQIVVDDTVYGAFNGQNHDSKTFTFHRIQAKAGTQYCDATGCIDWKIQGASCDSIDLLKGPNGDLHLLPADLSVGDVLAVTNMGAYSTSSGGFNGIDPAGVYLAWREGEQVVYQRSPLFRRSKLLLAHLAKESSMFCNAQPLPTEMQS